MIFVQNTVARKTRANNKEQTVSHSEQNTSMKRVKLVQKEQSMMS